MQNAHTAQVDQIEHDTPIDALALIIRQESDALLATLPEATARQWSSSPVPKPREDTPQRASGDRPADPTGDIVLDARRLAVRDTVVRSERALLHAARTLRGVRLSMESAVARFDGEGLR